VCFKHQEEVFVTQLLSHKTNHIIKPSGWCHCVSGGTQYEFD